MISDVVLVGIAKENLKRGFRNFDVDSINPLTESRTHSLIIVNYWTKEEYTRLNPSKICMQQSTASLDCCFTYV